jgi:hypothetical protein
MVCLLAMGLSLGCGGADPADLLAAANDSNVQRLANLYEAFQSRHNWRGPKDEEEFKSFLKGWNPKKLSNIGVDPKPLATSSSAVATASRLRSATAYRGTSWVATLQSSLKPSVSMADEWSDFST